MTELMLQFASGSLGAAISLLIVGFLARESIVARIRESVAAEFRREHEKYVAELKWEQSRREKASQIADVVSSWIALEHVPSKKADPQEYLDVQRKYWELALWLDTDSLEALNAALTRREGAHYKLALAKVRTQLVEKGSRELPAEKWVHFPLPEQTS